jgi:type VI protein secretion system component Hcp
VNIRDAIFERKIWNHFENSVSRPNNNLEGYHFKLNKRAGKVRPNVYELISILQEIQLQNDIELYRYNLVKGQGNQKENIVKSMKNCYISKIYCYPMR